MHGYYYDKYIFFGFVNMLDLHKRLASLLSLRQLVSMTPCIAPASTPCLYIDSESRGTYLGLLQPRPA